MTKRALIIGSQTGGLQGVHADVEVMDDALAGLGFDTVTATEGAATSAGILERYRGLIDDTRDGDAVVVYYSGHGGRQRNALATSDPSAPPWLHFIVPTDIDDRSDERFRGVLAQELSQLQHELTEKTVNVTTILDCCHSARMSRDPAMVPKADGQIAAFPWADLERRWAALRSNGTSSAPAGDSNPLAVRIVACSPDQSAYELAETGLGGAHGALTSTLVPILRTSTSSSLSWREVLALVRPAIMDILPQQRPEIEGPVQRLLFDTATKDGTGVLGVRVDAGAGVALLTGAGVSGVAEGDTYAIVAPGSDPRQPLATAAVDRLVGDEARLRLDGVAATDLPAGASAHPLRVSLGARPVAVVPPGHPQRGLVVDGLRGSPHVRVVDQTTGVLATVRMDDSGMSVLDAAGEPLHRTPRPPNEEGVDTVSRDLQKLARATHLRELASGTGPAELPDDVEVSYARLLPEGADAEEVALAASGEHLFNGDRVVVRLRNSSDQTRYASVLDVGISGGISAQTTSEPDGVTLAAKEVYEVGRDPAGALTGLEMYWPPAVPETAPRPETFVTIVSDAKVSGLTSLSQEGIRSAGAPEIDTAGTSESELERFVGAVNAGRRDARPAAAAADGTRQTRYRVHRFDFVFHPVPRGEEADEPAFEVDERPDPSFRLVLPRSAAAPVYVAVRLKELTVHSNRSLLASTVRIDAMIVTAPPEGSGEPYRAATARFDRVKDGDRLPFDDLLVYEGAVGRFVDLAVWVSRDDQRDLDLADLLAAETGSEEVKGAVAVLAGLGLAAPHAAAVAASTAAVAALVRTGARLLDAVRGKGIGVYRTSLLPHQRFGAGPAPSEAGRHPSEGLIRAQDMSFAFEVVDLGAN